MIQVVIQPSYGNPAARRHWDDTLAREVSFDSPANGLLLTPGEMASLQARHSSGSARFWGATGTHDARMSTLSTGDVVLFTGQKKIRAVGEVGVSFRNAAFADALWTPDPVSGSWHNVYSLLAFQPTDMAYEEVWELPGFNTGDNFMGLRFLSPDLGETVLDGLGIRTLTAAVAESEEAIRVAAELAANNGTLLEVEGVHTAQTSYERQAGTVLVNRAESLLLQAYRGQLPAGLSVKRMKTASGITDLHVVGEGQVEIVEAKSAATHEYVRQALAQLLDYAVHSSEPPTRLSALFPSPPSPEDNSLLHRFGIDVIHLTADGKFNRINADENRRATAKTVWAV